jgi:hypothetical protein
LCWSPFRSLAGALGSGASRNVWAAADVRRTACSTAHPIQHTTRCEGLAQCRGRRSLTRIGRCAAQSILQQNLAVEIRAWLPSATVGYRRLSACHDGADGPASWCTRRYMSILFICVYLRTTRARTERRVDGRKALVLVGYGISTFAYLLAWQVRTHARSGRSARCDPSSMAGACLCACV